MAKTKRPKIKLPKARGPSKPDQVARAKEIFCEALRRGYDWSEACEEINVTENVIEHWKETDFRFARSVGSAYAFGVLPLERKHIKYAFDGVPKVLTHKGRISYKTDPETKEETDEPETVLEIDLNAQYKILQALMPEKYDPAIRAKVWERINAPDDSGGANVQDIATLAGLLAKVATAKASTVDPDEDGASE